MEFTRKFVSWTIYAVALLPLSQIATAQSPLTFRYLYDSLNQLSRVIDSAGNVVTYTYDDAGNLVSVKRTTVASLQQPKVTSVTPNQIIQGESAVVVLAGTSLLGAVDV